MRGEHNGWKQRWVRNPYKCTRCGTVIGAGERVWFHLATRHVLHLFCGPGLADGSAPRYTPTHEIVLMNDDGPVPQYRIREKK